MSVKNKHIAAVLTVFALATAVRWRRVLPAIAVMGTVTLISGCAMGRANHRRSWARKLGTR